MENTKNVMTSKLLPGSNKLEEIFYINKNSFEAEIEVEAKRVFNELIQMTCTNYSFKI